MRRLILLLAKIVKVSSRRLLQFRGSRREILFLGILTPALFRGERESDTACFAMTLRAEKFMLRRCSPTTFGLADDLVRVSYETSRHFPSFSWFIPVRSGGQHGGF